ncbi:MAG: hypothetical protein ACXACW_14840 [Candidatus Hodarchaeales archaeon]|jgi:hypothetical protein
MKKALLLPFILLLGVCGLFFAIPITAVTTASVIHYFDDFENGLSDKWTLSGDWHIEDNSTSNYPITDPLVTIPSGTHYMWFGDNTTGTYNNVTGYATWGPFDVSTITGKLEVSYYGWLWHWDEYLDVQYSSNGINWQSPFTGWFVAHTVRFSQLTYEIPYYAKTSTFYIRFRFNQNTLYGESAFGWRIDDVAITETPDYSIEFPKLGAPHALVGETTSLRHTVQLHFSTSQVTDICINMTSPSGAQQIIHESTVTLTSEETWNLNQDYTFTEEGDYNVTVEVVDEMGSHFYASDIWKIGPYVLLYLLESDYFANIGETGEMGFMIDSHYDLDTNFDITVTVETPSGSNVTIYEKATTVVAFEIYQFTVTYTFLENGYHYIYIMGIDELGREFTEYGGSVKVGPYFATWTENIEPYEEKYVGEKLNLNVFIEARTPTTNEINVQVKMINPEYVEDMLLEELNVLMNPSEIWNYTLTFICTKAGNYQLDVRIENSSNTADIWWGDRLHWFAIEELEIWIDQVGNYSSIGTEEMMTFNLINHFGYTMVLDIDISIETPSNEKTVIHEETITLQIGEAWNTTLSYTFAELGRYDLQFQVIYGSTKAWLVESWWRIQDEDSTTDTTPSLSSPGYESIVSFLTMLAAAISIRFYNKKKRI